MKNNPLTFYEFPKDFLWGVSTSAYQIEGGITNDWSVWEGSETRVQQLKKQGKKINEFICNTACDSWRLYEKDFNLLSELNCSAYRMGVEWARIEPKEGEFDQNAIEIYKTMFRSLKKRNISLVLTIWHWTNPIWISEAGGWTNRSTVDFFARFVELCVREFGEFVDLWIVLNEPMIHVGNGYLSGKFPPNKKYDLVGAYKTRRNLILAQKSAYKLIHNVYREAKVGFTTIANYIEPAHKINPIELILAKIYHWWWNLAFLNAVSLYIDFVAFDYYFHDRIVWRPPFRHNKNEKVTDLGWEIYPEGIQHVIKFLGRYKKPIYIMENGLADAKDKYRADFILNHLQQVHFAIKQGFDVRGYFHWSLLDNFEWAHGFEPKFGLYSVDRQTMERTSRPSASLYGEICKNNGFWIK